MSQVLEGLAGAITTSYKKWKRKPADVYPTPEECTEALLLFLGLDPEVVIYEPACGDGKLARVLEDRGYSVVASDIRTNTGYGQGGIDFLALEEAPPVDWVVTNPPFSLAPEFVLKALSVTPNVAFLLKSDYWHAVSRLPVFEKFPPAYVLALTWRPAFLEEERGNSPLMNVIWVIWKDGETDTRYRLLRKPKLFVKSGLEIYLSGVWIK